MRHPFHHRSSPYRRLIRVVRSHGQTKLIYEPPPDHEHRESNPILANMDGGGGNGTGSDRAIKDVGSDRAAAVPGKRVIGEEDDDKEGLNDRAVRPGSKRVFESDGREAHDGRDRQ